MTNPDADGADERPSPAAAGGVGGGGGRRPGAAPPIPVITPKEMKELRRVYEKLCYWSEKVHRVERLDRIRERLSELRRAEGGLGSDWDLGGAAASAEQGTNQLPPDDRQVRAEALRLEAERAGLEEELGEIRSRPEQHIRPQDTAAALRGLGHRASKREVHDMMWEVDEKLDGVVDWEEFRLMFERNVRDASGLEPASFYHVVQFMIYDRDDNGMVSIDETMHMLYARLGRERMESTITKLFGGDDGAPIKEVGHQGGEIGFARYWDVVRREQIKMFDGSELGRALAERKQKKKADFAKRK